ncbi:VOC family protein [Streptomyces sp. NPDC102360]|uniref:VOC family protein n=1 Tax=Streptomyces sp. NPDC102360 TaxID=3366160 RepID=UPI0037F83E77
MTSGQHTIIAPVRDLAAAKAVYTKLLGVEPSSDEAYYVGYDVAGQHFGLNPGGHQQGMTGPVGYWTVDDIQGMVKSLVESGAEIVQDVTEVGPGRRIASLKDADGNVFGVLQDS